MVMRGVAIAVGVAGYRGLAEEYGVEVVIAARSGTLK